MNNNITTDFDPRDFGNSIQKVIDKIKEEYVVSDFEFTVEKLKDYVELYRITFKHIKLKP